MIRLYLTVNSEQSSELYNHLYYNGYNVDWETDDVITIDEEEYEYIKTILNDRGIEFEEERFNKRLVIVTTDCEIELALYVNYSSLAKVNEAVAEAKERYYYGNEKNEREFADVLFNILKRENIDYENIEFFEVY